MNFYKDLSRNEGINKLLFCESKDRMTYGNFSIFALIKLLFVGKGLRGGGGRRKKGKNFFEKWKPIRMNTHF